MKEVNVLIIGGGPAGIIAGVTGKAMYPDKKFLLIRRENFVVVPCGIPYLFGSLGSFDMNIVLYDEMLSNGGVDLKIDTVQEVNIKNKSCKTSDGSVIKFEKLIFALGSKPNIPDWLEGRELKNVFTIPKNRESLDKIFDQLKKCKKIVIIGGGFIGVEVSDELNQLGKEVTIIEMSPHVLCPYCDEEITVTAEKVLKARGVKIIYGIRPKGLIGNTDLEVTGVELVNGRILNTDAVILALGYRPNTKIAEASGIKTNEMGAIIVDEFMRTGNPDILAVGDCAEKKDFITRKISTVMLSSTACAEARIAGMNLYKLCSAKTFAGTIATFFTKIGDVGLGMAGLSERLAKLEGFDIVTETFECVAKNPKNKSIFKKQIVKLIVARDSGIILGGEVVDGKGTGDLTNLIAFFIQNRMNINSILTAQFGSHPLLTAPPTANPLIKVAEIISMKINKVE